MKKQFLLLSLFALGVVAFATTPAMPAPARAASIPAAIAPVSSLPMLPAPTTAPGSAPVAPMEKVTIAEAPEPAVLALPFDVAGGLDLFRQEGLDVTTSNFRASDEPDFTIGVPAVNSQAQGQNMPMIASLMRWPIVTVLVRTGLKDKIKTIADLKGQTVKMAGARGTAEWRVMQDIVIKAGLKPDEVDLLT